MRSLLLTVGLLLVAAAPARAAEDPSERVREALRVLDGGDAERAVELLESVAAETPDAASKTVPSPAVVQLALGVALARSGRAEDSRAAYERALAAPDGGEAAGRALFNLGTSHLTDAFSAAESLRESGEAANGEPSARMLIAQKGLTSARAAVRALRDRVRAVPADKDAAHNLQVAQRTRRFLEEELQRQQEEQQQTGEPEDGEEGDEQQEGEPKESDDGQSGDEAEQGSQEGDEQSGQESEGGADGEEQADGAEQQPSASDGSEESEGEQPPPEQGTAGSGDETEDDPLRDLLEAAARRLRLVEEMRKSKMRRVRVERDW